MARLAKKARAFVCARVQAWPPVSLVHPAGSIGLARGCVCARVCVQRLELLVTLTLGVTLGAPAFGVTLGAPAFGVTLGAPAFGASAVALALGVEEVPTRKATARPRRAESALSPMALAEAKARARAAQLRRCDPPHRFPAAR